MKRVLTACALAARFLCACDVATVAQVPSNVAQNQCAGDLECPGGSCVEGQCQSHAGTLKNALFEITPPADTSVSSGLQFLQTAVALSPAGGDLELNLDAVSQFVGELVPDPMHPRSCVPKFDDKGTVLATAGDGSLPGTISLTPSPKALGLFSQSAVAQTTLSNASFFSFSLNVPPGVYDIYYQPQHQPDDPAPCIVPPQLLRAQQIKSGTFKLFIKVPEPSSFDFHVNWPSGDGQLSDWVVDMLDPVSGHVISNRAPLALVNRSRTDYAATVYYLPVVGDTSDQQAQELIRLSPPPGKTAPTLLLSRGALGLFKANSGTLSDFTSLPSVVSVHGQVTALATPKPVAATVTAVAKEIIGIEPGVLASFVSTVTADDDGQFTLDLLPGKYLVSAVPTVQLDTETSSSPDSKLAAVIQPWTVAEAPGEQAGKVIELSNALPINGAAFDASGSTAVVTALVQAAASTASTKTSVLDQALGQPVVVPRAATGRVQPRGDFALIADPGIFDVSVRPLAASGFSWLVVPGVAVGTADTIAGTNLMSRALPLPVVYRGTVTLPAADGKSSAPVPGALIRCFVYTALGAYTSDETKADSVVQVAETRAGMNGQFTLLIPATLNGAVH